MKHYYLVLILGLIGQLALANNDLGFVSPVDHTLRISGSFAEFRTNHFHSGIDIKSSKGRIGDPIYSVHEGYISRVKIQSGGYGNVIFVSHPNGYTSVYAHLDSYLPELMEYIKSIQYSIEAFEVEVHIPKGKFEVSKRQQIGIMGTTGRSTGPHLHFELRETKSDRPVNPYNFGIAPKDDIPPNLQNIAIYDLNKEVGRQRISISPLKAIDKNNFSLSSSLEVDASSIGLGIQMFDRMNGASNKNEVYKCIMTVDDTLVYKWEADRFDFSETKYVNARLDFQRKQTANQNIQLLYKQSCNGLTMIGQNAWDGNINLARGQKRRISIKSSDVEGNEVSCAFDIVRSKDAHEHDHDILNKNVICYKDTSIFFDGITIELSKATFYESSLVNIKRGMGTIDGKSYPTVELGSTTQAAHKFYKLTAKLPEGMNDISLVKRNKKGKLKTFGGSITDGFLSCYLDEFGSFMLYDDQSPPKIETVRFSSNRNKYDEWRFLITDNLDPDGYLDDLIYEAHADDQWIRLIYDKKNDLIRIVDFDKIPADADILTIKVWDNQGNLTQRSYPLKS